MKSVKNRHVLTLVNRYYVAIVSIFGILLYFMLTILSLPWAEEYFSQDLRNSRARHAEYLASFNASGCTVGEILKSIGVYEKVNKELLAYVGISLDAEIDNTRFPVMDTWENSNLLSLDLVEKNDFSYRCAFDVKTGRLERALAFLYPNMNPPSGISDSELKKLIISKEEALAKVEKVVALAGLDIEIQPEKIEFKPEVLTWHYTDWPEFHGIRSQSRFLVGVQAVTGKIRAFSLYNSHLPPPEETEAVLTDKDALDAAILWGKDIGYVPRPETVSLTYALASNLWSGQRDVDPYVVEDKFRLCWSVALVPAKHPDHLCEGIVVFVDACSGEIVGGMGSKY